MLNDGDAGRADEDEDGIVCWKVEGGPLVCSREATHCSSVIVGGPSSTCERTMAASIGQCSSELLSCSSPASPGVVLPDYLLPLPVSRTGTTWLGD